MTIARSAVEAFLAQPLADSGKAKRLSAASLKRRLGALDPPLHTVYEPRIHQAATLLLCLKYPQYVVLADPGLGKTKIMLDLAALRAERGQVKRVLVLVPFASLTTEWVSQYVEHRPQAVRLSAYAAKAPGALAGIYGTSSGSSRDAKQQELLHGASNVFVTTYAWFLQQCSSKEAGRKGLTLSDKKVRELGRQFDMVVCDESSLIGNHQSKTFKALRKLAKYVEYRYPMTGTPFNKNPERLWPQFFFADGGATLGPTLGLFRAAYFNEVQNYFRAFEYKFKASMQDDLARRLRHRSIRYEAEECLDLPECVGGLSSRGNLMTRSVEWPEANWRYFENLTRELKEARGDQQAIDNVYLRMRQVTSGYLGLDGEEIVFDYNPKLEGLIDLLHELPADRKVIVFHVYRTAGRLVSERLKKEKISHRWIHGKSRDKEGAVRDFREKKGVRVLLSSMAGSMGLNLQCANYTVFYETPDAADVRLQAERRTHRSGQKRRTFIYDMVVHNSVDARILRSIREGKRIQDVLLDGFDV